MSYCFRLRLLAPLMAVFVLLSTGHGEETLPEKIEFNRDVRPILSDVCFHCHGPDSAQRKGNLRFDQKEGAFADLGKGHRAIVPGKPQESELIRRIRSTDSDEQMPPPDLDRKLSQRQIEVLTRWIEQGANWDAHWSFVKLVRPRLPAVKSFTSARSPLDLFILAKLEREGLASSNPAEKLTLLRRVTLDLTGLPPTRDEVDSFLLDSSPDAYERVVDRLLASGRFGERMAARWLNAARYADTSGYQSDGERVMWRWRDWVIDAFNANMPFDQFTVEQLAGDLLPRPSLDQLIATGFNRNHRGNAEGGIIPEEYAVEYVVDRVETTSTVWLGLTVMCARCHNHKYDPIAQTDFYQLYGFFNQVPEKGRAVKYGNSPPYVISPTRDQQIELTKLQQQLAAATFAWRSRQDEVKQAEAAWERGPLPDVPICDCVRDRLTLHFPLDGNAIPAVAVPIRPARPAGYLGQTRLLAPPPTNSSAPVETGDPQYTAGRSGQVLDCDGRHYAAVGDVANFGFFDRFSVATWIRPTSEQGGTIISRMSDVPHGDGWCVVLEKNTLQVHLTKRWLDDACRVATAKPIPSKEWRHVVVTYDGSRETAGIQIYLDGVRQEKVTLLDELNQSFENKGPLRIGAGNGPDGRFHGSIDDVRIFDRVLTPDEAAILAETATLSAIAAIPSQARTPAQVAALDYYFVRHAASDSIRSVFAEYQLRTDGVRNYLDELPTTMVMQDSTTPREAHVLLRGEYDKRGERVSPGVPASLPPLPGDSTRNRLALAQWLVDPSHPLTSRVAVNRLWQMLFGLGLVKTIDDFGTQGEWPSHPELLDWLAIEFQHPTDVADQPPNSPQRTWDTKRMLRMLTASATYRQSSQTSETLTHRDPENRLLARGPRFRLPAEMIRDQALASSGLLVEQLGGPSVKPYQPEGLWKDLAGLDYDQDHGASLYRRGLYTYWKRTAAPPSMITFDAAGRETCIVKESRTNTPLQALNLMNDVTYVEAARMLGERMLTQPDVTPSGRVAFAFATVLGRSPRSEELAVLTAGYDRHRTYFQAHSDNAEALTKIGEHPRNAQLDVVELAASTTIASLILNLDEAVTRE